MDTGSRPSEPLPLLARLYRERRSGLLTLGSEPAPLRVLLRNGQVAALGPVAPPPPAARPTLPPLNDSAQFRLERALVEVGIRPKPKATPAPADGSARDPRERLLEALGDVSLAATFVEGGDPPPDMAGTAGATEPLILEAVRRLPDPEAVRAALGDVSQRLVATSSLTEERTLTPTEGYFLSRIDGLSSARQVLQLVPLDPEEAERTLLGLLLTGCVEYWAAPAAPAVSRSEPDRATPTEDEPGPAEDSTGPTDETKPDRAAEAFPGADLADESEVPVAEGIAPKVVGELDRETRHRRRQILGLFQSLPRKNHFEVLGVEPGCSDAEVKRGYAALAKRYHPDVNRDPRLEDLRDILEAIFIRVGEAWEILGDPRSRASYEARFGLVRPPPRTAPTAPAWQPPPPEPPAPEPEYVHAEATLTKARLLLAQARYLEVIQLLEAVLPQMEPRRHQHKGRILLAKAYATNPSWVRRAEEYLQEVVRADPANVEAQYELGLLYKQIGHTARAQAAFRRVVELRPEHREAAAELGLAEGSGGGGLLKRLFGRGRAS